MIHRLQVYITYHYSVTSACKSKLAHRGFIVDLHLKSSERFEDVQQPHIMSMHCNESFTMVDLLIGTDIWTYLLNLIDVNVGNTCLPH